MLPATSPAASPAAPPAASPAASPVASPGRVPGRQPGGEPPAMSDLGSALGLGIAFVGGVVSFASPCCLPLVPAYLGYMVGATNEGRSGRRAALLHGLSFVLGFSLVFVAFYAAIGLVGHVLDRRTMNMIGGALLVFLGLQVAGVINVRALWRDTRAMPVMGGGLVMAGGSGGGNPGSAGRPSRASRPSRTPTRRATRAASSSACCSRRAGAPASARSWAASSASPPPRRAWRRARSC